MSRQPTIGDRVEVSWLDPQSRSDGDPEDAELFCWMEMGYFIGYRPFVYKDADTLEEKELECLVIAKGKGKDDGDTEDAGWTIIPKILIQDIQVLPAPVEYADA